MSTNEQPDTSIPLDRVNSEYHNTTCIRETLLTAEGHQYSGELCLVKGHAGLQQHGRGELRYVHGDIYAGGFELGKRTGFGTCKYASGAQYDGEWNDDVFHGCGQWVGIDGYLYEGSYCNGLPHGTGREVIGAKNEEYIGRFVNGQRDGSGVWTREDGSKYSGTFRDGLPDGKGVLMFPDGSRCFEGSFSKGQMHGKGVMEFANGDRYDGWYENGRALTNGKYQFIPKRDSSSQSPHNSGTVNKLLTATDPTPNVEIDRARECDQATLRANTAELECISFNTRRNAEGVVQEAESDELLIRFPSSTDEQQVLRRPSDDWTQGFGTIVFKKNRERYEGAFVRCTPHGSGCKVYYCPHYSGNVMDSPPAERHSFYKGVWTDGKPGVGFGIMTWCIANESVESNIEKSEEDIDRIQQIPKGNAGYPEADVAELGCIKPYPMTTDYIKWRYEGQWLMGLPNGHGIMYFHPTGTYQGAWTKGVPCGFGCEDLDDERYEGAMDMGVRHGPHGELWIKKTGKHVTGTFVDGWCDDDKGTISCEDYDFYGTIRRNCEEGLGQQKYRNGDVYDGEFREGKKCGCGIMNYQSLGEVVYEGQWKDDKPHGQGIWRFPDGSHYEGGFECGLRHGNGVQYDVEKDLEFTVRYDLGNRIE